MKNLTKQAVAELFKMNPSCSTLYATSDGEVFVSENYAKQYAKESNLEGKEITPIQKEIELADDSTTTTSVPKADELIALIKAVTTAEELTGLVLPEGEKRATVIKALADKKKELGVE